MNEKNQGWRESTNLFKFVQDQDVVEISLNPEFMLSTPEHMPQYSSAQHQNAVVPYVPRAHRRSTRQFLLTEDQVA